VSIVVVYVFVVFFFQAEDGIRDATVTGVQTCALPISVNFWRRWVARNTYGGRWRETVNRSALTLKLLTSRQYGSIVAAPTFGLQIGRASCRERVGIVGGGRVLREKSHEMDSLGG